MKPYYLANRAYLQALRTATPCAHCGGGPVEWHNPEHIERPHRRIGNMTGSARAAIDAELARCTPLCRRCHMAEDGRLRRLTDENPNPPGKRRPAKACVECGSTTSPYLRRGLCGRCYDRRRRRALKGTTVNPEPRHLCGHLALHPTPETPTTFCIKCAAWGCTMPNCPGHQRWHDQAEA